MRFLVMFVTAVCVLFLIKLTVSLLFFFMIHCSHVSLWELCIDLPESNQSVQDVFFVLFFFLPAQKLTLSMRY